MSRRYGKVTVTGWIHEYGPTVTLWKQCEGGYPVVDVALGPTDSVEFLPEPVVFKDGDVLKHVQPSLWLRRRGVWVNEREDSPGYDDVWAERMLRHNLAVRLVPEVKGGS